MKATLSIEESGRLIKLGVDAKLASEIEYRPKKSGYGRNKYMVYSLTDILSILPKEIDGYCLNISFYMDEWYAYYEKIKKLGKRIILRTHTSPELIDALYQLLIWTIESKYINLTTDKT